MERRIFVRYDDMFDSGDPEKDEFMNNHPEGKQLREHFIRIIE
jgi:hypothetical protein